MYTLWRLQSQQDNVLNLLKSWTSKLILLTHNSGMNWNNLKAVYWVLFSFFLLSNDFVFLFRLYIFFGQLECRDVTFVSLSAFTSSYWGVMTSSAPPPPDSYPLITARWNYRSCALAENEKTTNWSTIDMNIELKVLHVILLKQKVLNSVTQNPQNIRSLPWESLGLKSRSHFGWKFLVPLKFMQVPWKDVMIDWTSGAYTLCSSTFK